MLPLIYLFSATLVLARLERAIKTKAIAEETLNQLMSGPFEGNFIQSK